MCEACLHLPPPITLVPVVIKQKEPWISVQETQILLFWALSLLSCVTLDKSLHFSGPWFPHVSNERSRIDDFLNIFLDLGFYDLQGSGIYF